MAKEVHPEDPDKDLADALQDAEAQEAMKARRGKGKGRGRGRGGGGRGRKKPKNEMEETIPKDDALTKEEKIGRKKAKKKVDDQNEEEKVIPPEVAETGETKEPLDQEGHRQKETSTHRSPKPNLKRTKSRRRALLKRSKSNQGASPLSKKKRVKITNRPDNTEMASSSTQGKSLKSKGTGEPLQEAGGKTDPAKVQPNENQEHQKAKKKNILKDRSTRLYQSILDLEGLHHMTLHSQPFFLYVPPRETLISWSPGRLRRTRLRCLLLLLSKMI